ARALHFQPPTTRGMDRPHENCIATGASQDCSHWRRIRTQRAEAFDRAACLALRVCERHITGEKLLNKSCATITVQHEVGDVISHGTCPPEGPKRSVLIVRGSCPSSTRKFATSSTKGVDPQIKIVGFCCGGKRS